MSRKNEIREMLDLLERFWEQHPEMSLGEIVRFMAGDYGHRHPCPICQEHEDVTTTPTLPAAADLSDEEVQEWLRSMVVFGKENPSRVERRIKRLRGR